MQALLKGRSNIVTLRSVMRRTFASGSRAGFVSSFRSIPPELNYSDKGSRFFNRDYDSTKSLLHVLAQRITRSSPARTIDQDCISHSLTHLDVGEVDFTSHIHVPAVSVQSHVPSDVLSNCTRHAAAVSSRKPSVIGRGDRVSGSVSHGSGDVL